MAAGNWVRSMGLDTYAGLLCESACAYLWLGGVHKYANEMVVRWSASTRPMCGHPR